MKSLGLAAAPISLSLTNVCVLQDLKASCIVKTTLSLPSGKTFFWPGLVCEIKRSLSLPSPQSAWSAAFLCRSSLPPSFAIHCRRTMMTLYVVTSDSVANQR